MLVPQPEKIPVGDLRSGTVNFDPLGVSTAVGESASVWKVVLSGVVSYVREYALAWGRWSCCQELCKSHPGGVFESGGGFLR